MALWCASRPGNRRRAIAAGVLVIVPLSYVGRVRSWSSWCFSPVLAALLSLRPLQSAEAVAHPLVHARS